MSVANNFANNLTWGALSTYTVEVYPTELRASGAGAANMVKSLAGLLGLSDALLPVASTIGGCVHHWWWL